MGLPPLSPVLESTRGRGHGHGLGHTMGGADHDNMASANAAVKLELDGAFAKLEAHGGAPPSASKGKIKSKIKSPGPHPSVQEGGGSPHPGGGGGGGACGGGGAAAAAANNRKEWAVREDQLIWRGVQQIGCKWRQIAAMLPGRSDDAVRNRYNRLKEAEASGLVRSDSGEPTDPNAPGTPSGGGGGGGGGTGTYRCSKCGQLKKNHVCTAVVTGDARPKSDDKRRPERVGWTKAEDAIITHSVQELGHRWYQIAERLPGRTDHAIRNRWHRLLTMRQEELARGGGEAGGRGPSPTSEPSPPMPLPGEAIIDIDIDLGAAADIARASMGCMPIEGNVEAASRLAREAEGVNLADIAAVVGAACHPGVAAGAPDARMEVDEIEEVEGGSQVSGA